MSYDRQLWEAMRSAFLKDKVVSPEEFVRPVNLQETVVVHCDQVPVWLRIGGAKQLYKASEVKKRKRHKVRRRGGNTGYLLRHAPTTGEFCRQK